MAKIQLIPINASNSLQQAMQAMRQGQVIAIPTDTVYGIACMIYLPSAIEQIYTIKGRESTKAIPILIGDISQLTKVAQELNSQAKLLADKFWPGALTLVVARRSELPIKLSPYPTVGVRMPKHDWLRQLILTAGPLAVTSANLSGQPDATTAEEVLIQLHGNIKLVIDGGRCAAGIPSTVVDCSTTEVKILREGAIKAQLILDSLR